VECKNNLALHLNAQLEPLRERRRDLAQRPDAVWDLLKEGARRARLRAAETMSLVRDAMHLTRP
jgi:tryptophanyl-tRNA synthetase